MTTVRRINGIGPKATRKPKADEPFCGLLFKVQADKHGD